MVNLNLRVPGDRSVLACVMKVRRADFPQNTPGRHFIKDTNTLEIPSDVIAIDDSKRKIKGQMGGISPEAMKIIAVIRQEFSLQIEFLFFLSGWSGCLCKGCKSVPKSALRAFWRFRVKIMLIDDSVFVSLKSRGAVINAGLARGATKR